MLDETGVAMEELMEKEVQRSFLRKMFEASTYGNVHLGISTFSHAATVVVQHSTRSGSRGSPRFAMTVVSGVILSLRL